MSWDVIPASGLRLFLNVLEMAWAKGFVSATLEAMAVGAKSADRATAKPEADSSVVVTAAMAS